MMRNIIIKMFIEVESNDKNDDFSKQNLEISYKLNECCSNLEGLKASVTYRMEEDGSRIYLDNLS